MQYNVDRVSPVATMLWMDNLRDYTRAECGRMGQIFSFEEGHRRYQVPQDLPAPSEPPHPEGRRDELVEKQTLKIAIVQRAEAMRKLEQNKVKVFGLMMGQLSLASQDAMARDPKYATLQEDANDPIGLLNLVIVSHMTRGDVDEMKNKQYASQDYSRLTPGADESLLSFKLRFKAAILVLQLVGEPKITEERRAADFLLKLEGSMWDEAVRAHRNDGGKCSTLDMAIEYVTNFAYAKHPKAGRAWAVVGQTMSRDHVSEHEDDYGAPDIEANVGRRTGQDLACFNCSGPHMLRDCNKQPTSTEMAEAMNKAQARKARRERKKATGSNAHDADLIARIVRKLKDE
ncbi:hypothetical protein FVE85_0174 [Porphyridium purpureum]|uniref:Uncharacterized protein n=1 Tax=Porphyridium purpureum TaxID=35688 RepID=A0A5J4YZ96_PORPP|nr:hypothetical protein FVE85_0174 [Porphyridium purpureum]|eukprot:POR7975..scf208_2